MPASVRGDLQQVHQTASRRNVAAVLRRQSVRWVYRLPHVALRWPLMGLLQIERHRVSHDQLRHQGMQSGRRHQPGFIQYDRSSRAWWSPSLGGPVNRRAGPPATGPAGAPRRAAASPTAGHPVVRSSGSTGPQTAALCCRRARTALLWMKPLRCPIASLRAAWHPCAENASSALSRKG